MKDVVLLTDEPVLFFGLRAMLAESESFNLVAACRDTTEFATIAFQRQPDILMVTLPADLGRLREVSRIAPLARIVLWTRDASIELAHQALELGVRGVVSTTAGLETVIRCLQGVASGEMWMEQSLTMNLLTSRPVALTRRQSELLRLLVQGLKNKEIATNLGISEGTVKAYLTRLFEKVGAKDRFELALFGLKNMSYLGASEPKTSNYGNLRSIVLPRPSQRHTA